MPLERHNPYGFDPYMIHGDSQRRKSPKYPTTREVGLIRRHRRAVFFNRFLGTLFFGGLIGGIAYDSVLAGGTAFAAMLGLIVNDLTRDGTQ